MKNGLKLASSVEVGHLGIVCLKRFWSREILKRNGQSIEATNNEGLSDKILLSGLGVALEETIQHLYLNLPTFEEFENWILEINGGNIDPIQIDRINSAMLGKNHSEKARKWLKEIENDEPVLNQADIDFWSENGYVIVRNAIPKDVAKESEQAVWEHLKMNPKDSGTWYDTSNMQGIMVQFFHHPAFQTNRKQKRIHKAFAQIWETADLWTSVDRVGFNPPEKPGFWQFQGPNLHWDIDFRFPLEFRTQGILYLTDVSADQGAFTCVPGFHLKLENWLKDLPADADPNEQNLESLGAIPVAANAGDFIIWHQYLPHGSSPNRANYPRIVQYINMFPDRQDNFDIK